MRAQKIFENPNAIYTDRVIEWYDDCIAFGRYGPNDVLFVGTKTHDDLSDDYGKTIGYSNGRGIQSGRLFVEEKVITFWDFPENKKEFIGLIKELETKTDLNILNDNDWKVELPKIQSDIKGLELNPRDKSWGSWKPNLDTASYITFDQYQGGYERSKEELAQEHSKSPMLKRQRNVPKGIGSNSDKKNPLDWKQAMFTSESYYPRLNENPNAILDPKVWQKKFDKEDWSYKDIPAKYDQIGNISFAYPMKDKLIISKNPEKIHDDMRFKGKRVGRTPNSGRLFIKQKVVTFWEFPKTHTELLKVLSDLENKLGLTIVDDKEWRIEIPWGQHKNELDSKKKSWGTWHPMVIDSKFIPIGEYRGGYKRSNDEMAQKHIATPMSKHKLSYNDLYNKGYRKYAGDPLKERFNNIS